MRPGSHAHQRMGVGRALITWERPQDREVTGTFQIAPGRAAQEPDHRVKPVDAPRDLEQEFAQAVQPADMGQLVGQNVGQGVIGEIHVSR